MGQRNMMIDSEMEQQSQGYVQPEPCIFLGSTLTSYPQPDVPVVITASGNVPNLEAHALQEPYENAMFYGIPQYHGVQHNHHHPHASNLDVGISAAPNFYVPYMAAHTPPSQLPSSSNQGLVGISSDEYERNAHFMDPTRGSYKRKNAEGTPGNPNPQYLSTTAAPSSYAPLNISTNDAAPFAFPQFLGTGSNPQLGQRSVRNRLGAAAMDPVLAHGQNNIVQGNFISQPFPPPPGSIWFDQQQMSNGRTDGAPSPWSQTSPLPYMHGSNVASGSIDSGSISLPRFHETSSSRNPTAFIYPSPLNPGLHYFSHHPSPPPMQGVRGPNSSVYPHISLASFRAPPGSYASQSTGHDGSEMVFSHVGPAQPTGFRIHRHHRDGPVPEPALRHRALPHLRVMPTDEVALLEVGDFYDTDNHIDHHRDMRLDIDEMSYEELLALSERIGTVNTGLSEETVKNHLKTRIYLSTGINLEEAPTTDLETDSCIICQENYRNQEEIGTLGCGHEYHAECLKKWLFVKNVCPICKLEALASKK